MFTQNTDLISLKLHFTVLSCTNPWLLGTDSYLNPACSMLWATQTPLPWSSSTRPQPRPAWPRLPQWHRAAPPSTPTPTATVRRPAAVSVLMT